MHKGFTFLGRCNSNGNGILGVVGGEGVLGNHQEGVAISEPGEAWSWKTVTVRSLMAVDEDGPENDKGDGGDDGEGAMCSRLPSGSKTKMPRRTNDPTEFLKETEPWKETNTGVAVMPEAGGGRKGRGKR